MISALLPSRGRPESLRRSVESLRELAANPEQVEVLVAVDPDDDASFHAATQLPDPAAVVIAPERYGYARLHEYINTLAKVATGDWLLNWNDDAFMTTPGWDQQLNDLPAHVLVADLHNALSPHLCCFPAVRREAVEALGGFCTAGTPHIDTWWQDIGRRSGTIHPVEAHVHHDRFDLTGGHDDQTWWEGRSGKRTEEYYGATIQGQINAAAETLTALVADRRPA